MKCYVQTVLVITQLMIQIALNSYNKMRILQSNIQSVNTSKYFIKQACNKHQPDVIALQEVWALPKDFEIKGYVLAAKKLRATENYGGVAIFCKKNAKIADIGTTYETDGLEATWADIMIKGKRIVIGSVYINVGKIGEIDLLEEVIQKVYSKHKHMVVCMDANSRDPIWDPSCMKTKSSAQVRKMDVKMASLTLNHQIEIHNNGQITYESGPYATAVDMTVSRGIQDLGQTRWRTIEDELHTPHKGILLDIGDQSKSEKKSIIDWKKFDWKNYENQSKISLQNLILKWMKKVPSVENMAAELKKMIEDLVEKIATKKTITSHSKPWISNEISEIFKELRSARNCFKKHRNPGNIQKYKDLLKQTSEKLEKAQDKQAAKPPTKYYGPTNQSRKRISV